MSSWKVPISASRLPKHDPSDHAYIVALTPSGDPPDRVADHDVEVDCVSAHNCARRREIRPHPVEVAGMYA
jgi:hypothetical protein